MGTFAGFLVIGFAQNLWMLFLGRMIDGLTAGNLSIAQAYISDVTRPADRTRSFALIGIAFGSGFLFGPLISGELTHRFGFAAPAFMAAGLSLLSIILSSTLLPGQAELDRIKAEVAAEGGEAPVAPGGQRNLALGRFLSQPVARRRLLQFFAFTTSFAVITGGLALFLERQLHFRPREVGWVYGVSGGIGVVIQGGAIKKLVARFGEAKLALIGFVSMVVAYPFLGAVHSFGALILIVAVSSFGVAVVRPCLTTLITKSVGREEQGAALGTSQSLASISQIFGPETAGFFIQHELRFAYGFAAAAVALVGAVLSLLAEPSDTAVADSA
jgi:MFS family permease